MTIIATLALILKMSKQTRTLDITTSSRSKKTRLSGAARYGTKYNSEWKSDFPFISSTSDGSEFNFHCKICVQDFSCHHQGKTGVKRHEKSKMHQKKIEAVEKSA